MNKSSQAHMSLLKLVEYVFQHRRGLIKGVTYETLAAWIGRLNRRGVGHAHGMGKVLGQMGHLLRGLNDEWGREPPHIQSLVVLKNGPLRDLPAEGISEFWPSYPQLSRAGKIDRVQAEYQDILNFGSRWNDVLAKLGLPPPGNGETLPFPEPSWYGKGESAQHKALKEFVLQHPEIVGAQQDWEGFEEFALPSSDIIDVLFKSSTSCIAVEVKSSVSDGYPFDYERGIYQTIKYGVLLKAMALDPAHLFPHHVQSVLLLESTLPMRARELARILGVTVIEKARHRFQER